MFKFLFTLLSLCSIAISIAQDNIVCHHFDINGQTREHTVDFQSMVLHIDFDTDAKKVIGEVGYTFMPIRKSISELILDAPNIQIDEVFLDGESTSFTTDEQHLVINFDKELYWEKTYNLKVSYSTIPAKGIYFYGWDDSTNRAYKQIWTQGQGIDNRHWIPSFDDVSDKLLTETFIRFKKGFEVISNGDLISKKSDSDTTDVWHYKMQQPHVVYLVMIAIGEFDYKDMVSSSGIVNRQYFYKDKPEEFEPTYRYSVEMMNWMEKEFDVDYPWGKIYRNVPVADFLYGAMENTTSTIFTDYYLQNEREALERNYINTNAHELTHQWFGDLITEWNGESHWLHESFATHYAKHFTRTVSSEDDFQWARLIEMRRAFAADAKDDLPIAHSKAGSARHYPKGSIVIDMLRDAAGGDEQYQKVISNYLNKYAFKHVDTHLFQLAFMETLGLNLNWFFDQWVYKGGFPKFEVAYETSKDNTVLRVKQIQEQTNTVGVFTVDVDIEVGYKNGQKELFTRRVDQVEQVIELPKAQKNEIAYVVFDAGNKLYKQLKFERSTEELIKQAQSAENMIDRYLATAELADIPLKDKRNALVDIYNHESFYAIKGQVVKQLANDDNRKSMKILERALTDADKEVRAACISFMDDVPENLLPAFESLLKDSSYVNIQNALGKLVKLYPENTERYIDMTREDAQENDLLKVMWLNVQAENGDTEALSGLVDYSSNSFEFRTRIRAIEMLESLAYEEDDFLLNLINASVSFNRRLAGEAKSTLETLVQTDQEKRHLEELITTLTLDANEEVLIEKMWNKLND